MEQNKTPEKLQKEQVTPKPASKTGSVKLLKPSNKMMMLGLMALLAIIFISGAVLAAYSLGRSNPDNNLEQKRQTVVQEGEVIADVAEDLSPSVVSIVTRQQSEVRSLYYGSRLRNTQAAGTGVIIDSNGLILTNKHVVPEDTSSVEVVTSEGETYEDVEVVGRDSLNDLAILRVKNAKNFKAAVLGESDSVRTGQKVIAIGNALGQFQNTVTSGIISGMGRPIEASDENGAASEQLTNLFQTDAAINSGNSGGPLLNFNGEVIGINTAVAAGAENIGFAIPINEAKGIIESVRTTGKVTRPYIGVRYSMLTADAAKELNITRKDGAYVSTEEGSILSGSPAEKAGLKGGDVITKVNNISLSDTVSLASAVSRFKVGETVELTIVRSDKEQKVKVKLEEAPAS